LAYKIPVTVATYENTEEIRFFLTKYAKTVHPFLINFSLVANLTQVLERHIFNIWMTIIQMFCPFKETLVRFAIF